MFAWTNTTFEGRPINFWDQPAKQGVVEHVKFEERVSGRVYGSFTAVIHHVDTQAPSNRKVALEERWKVRVYRCVEFFLIDFESKQRCAGKSPLVINRYHYGGMAIRGHRSWTGKGNGEFLTSDSKARKNGNHTRPRWVDLHGKIDAKPTGVAILCHPNNFRFPQTVRLHPSMPYFCFSPMVEEPFKIEPGQEYVSRYRFFIHNGSPTPTRIEDVWKDYAAASEARIISK